MAESIQTVDELVARLLKLPGHLPVRIQCISDADYSRIEESIADILVRQNEVLIVGESAV